MLRYLKKMNTFKSRPFLPALFSIHRIFEHKEEPGTTQAVYTIKEEVKNGYF